jgi:hypothetical protein
MSQQNLKVRLVDGKVQKEESQTLTLTYKVRYGVLRRRKIYG